VTRALQGACNATCLVTMSQNFAILHVLQIMLTIPHHKCAQCANLVVYLALSVVVRQTQYLPVKLGTAPMEHTFQMINQDAKYAPVTVTCAWRVPKQGLLDALLEPAILATYRALFRATATYLFRTVARRLLVALTSSNASVNSIATTVIT
jgi:hypothetical protein